MRSSSDSSGWNAAAATGPCRHEHRMAVDRRQHLDAGAGALDDRRADEHGVERRRSSPRRRGRSRRCRPDGRSALRRTSMSMHAEAALVGAAVEHVGGQQDHPGARAEHRHAVARAARRSGSNRPRRLEQHRHRGRLAAGHAPARRRPSRSAGVADLDAVARRAQPSTLACAANAPCSASTPTFTWRPPPASRRRLPAALGQLDVELVDLLARHRLAETAAHLGEDVRVAEVRGRLDDRLRPRRRVVGT